MHFIRRVRVESHGTRNEHIVAVQHSQTASGWLTAATVGAVVDAINAGTTVMTHNDATGARALVLARLSSTGHRYIATVANGRESDNLLALPRF